MPIRILSDKVVSAAKKAGRAVKKAMPKKKVLMRRRGKLKAKKSLPKKVSKPGDMFNKQRADYEKAMNSAQKKGGSNGVGVGY